MLDPAAKEDDFNGLAILNDVQVEVLEVSGEFAKVRTVEYASSEGEAPTEGWLRQRNLARTKAKAKLSKDSERRIGLAAGGPPRKTEFPTETSMVAVATQQL